MNNKNLTLFKNGLLSLSLILGISFAHAADSKMAAKPIENKNIPAVDKKENDKRKAEFTKFNKENLKLNLDHVEKMRAYNIKYINAMFDRMAASQKEMNKMNEDITSGKTQPDAEKFKAKNEELRKESEKAQGEFMAQTKADDEKFQAMMKKRQEEMAKSNPVQAPAPTK